MEARYVLQILYYNHLLSKHISQYNNKHTVTISKTLRQFVIHPGSFPAICFRSRVRGPTLPSLLLYSWKISAGTRVTESRLSTENTQTFVRPERIQLYLDFRERKWRFERFGFGEEKKAAGSEQGQDVHLYSLGDSWGKGYVGTRFAVSINKGSFLSNFSSGVPYLQVI